MRATSIPEFLTTISDRDKQQCTLSTLRSFRWVRTGVGGTYAEERLEFTDERDALVGRGEKKRG